MVFYLDVELVEHFIEKFIENPYDIYVKESSATLFINGNKLYFKNFMELPACINLGKGFVLLKKYPDNIDKKLIKILKEKLKGKRVMYFDGAVVQEIIDKDMTDFNEVLHKIVAREL